MEVNRRIDKMILIAVMSDMCRTLHETTLHDTSLHATICPRTKNLFVSTLYLIMNATLHKPAVRKDNLRKKNIYKYNISKRLRYKLMVTIIAKSSPRSGDERSIQLKICPDQRC